MQVIASIKVTINTNTIEKEELNQMGFIDKDGKIIESEVVYYIKESLAQICADGIKYDNIFDSIGVDVIT